MARVFLAKDEILDRPVAVKILNPGHGDTDMGDRFRREGRTAARLAHPNIVSVYGAGAGEFEGREASYIVMEYIPGGDLKALIEREGPLLNGKLARLGAEVSSGLAHAHEKGVIHRDIKPHNVLIETQGRAKLTDFGIARALDGTQATQTGSYLGTALYSSPEQLRGEKVNPKSDVYSLGVTLYQAAVGEAPFTGAPIEVASQHINKEPTEPSARGARLSNETEALILACLQKDPVSRPTIEEAHERLLDAAAAASPARPTRQIQEPLISVEAPEKTGHTRAHSSEAPTTRPPLGGMLQKDYRGWWRRGSAILATALLLVLLGAAGVYAIAGDGGSDTAQAPQEESQQVSSPENTESQDTQPVRGAEDKASGKGEQEKTKAGNAGGDSPEEAVAQTVQQFYDSAADEDYGRSWGLMTPGWRQNLFSSQDIFINTFSTLNSVEFVEGPTATVSGDTATVSGVTIARHTDRTERNGGTWTLVYENGEWRISGWNVYSISSGPA